MPDDMLSLPDARAERALARLGGRTKAIARYLAAARDAFVDEGFTREEALVLVRTLEATLFQALLEPPDEG